jgi:2-methylcitrate dehydratase PrpD
MPSDSIARDFDLEAAVAKFVVGFSRADIDSGSLPAVKAILKDQLALQIGAVQLPWSREVRRFVEKPRPGSSTAVNEDATMDAADAAYLNATYGHGFEYDDVAANGHPGCCVVPTAIAVGEEVGATMGQVVEAMVAGYETYVRIGRLAAPDLVNAGWHAHSVLANFGAAAVSAKLHKMSADKVLHALAIALSHASATTEYTKSGGSIKRVHAGIAVRNGIEAARLARVGITGPGRYLTGQKGFFRNFIRRDVVEAAASDAFAADRPLQIGNVWLKAYCCCGAHHPYIDAMASLGGRVGQIESVDAIIQGMTKTLGDNPTAQQHGTRNIEELQFSLALQMSLAVLGRGNGYATHRAFLDGGFSLGEDSDVVEFSRRIKLIHSSDLDNRYPLNFVGEIAVHFKDGSSERIFMDGSKGMANHPLTPEEHRVKLDELSNEVIGPARAASLFEMIECLDYDLPVGELTRLLKSG